MPKSIIVLLLAGFIAACGGEENAPEESSAPPPSVIPENAPDPFARPDASSGPFPTSLRTACEAQGKFEPSLCACLDERAGKELGATAREFLTAQLGGDRKRAAELRKTLTAKQMNKAGAFMAKGLAECGKAAG